MRFVSFAALLISVLAACDRERDAPPPADDNANASANGRGTATSPPRALFAQPEAMGVLRAISTAEISVARVAQQVSLNNAVLGYANVIIADHTGITQIIDSALTRIGETPRENALSIRIRADGDSLTRALSALTGGFNNTFIEEQIRTHQQTLQLLDTAVIPSVRDTSLQNLLRAVRPTLAAHLQRAMQILTERQRAAAERGEEWISGFQPRPAPVVPTVPAPPETAPPETAPPETEPPPPPPPDTAPAPDSAFVIQN